MAGRFIVRNAEDQAWAPEPPPLTIGMGYEFDEDKDELNRAKHRYGLDSGQDLLWRLTLPVGSAPPVVGLTQLGRDDNEIRYRILTLDHESQLVDFVFTVRGHIGDDYRLRAISYRRAHYDPLLLSVFLQHITSDEIAIWLQQCAHERLTNEMGDWPITDVVEPERGRFLREFVPLPKMAAVLLEHSQPEVDAGVNLVERAEGRDVGGFSRIKMTLRPVSPIGERAMDHLFNGNGGLRYSYAIAPVVGELANRYLLRALAPPCMEAWSVLDDLHRGIAEASYSALSAKIWPAEIGLRLQPPAKAEVAIAFPRWTQAALAWSRDPQRESYLSGLGIQAPPPTRFEIKGGFINAEGTEYVPKSKDHRAEDIYHWGWS